jgi:hypothetical protein
MLRYTRLNVEIYTDTAKAAVKSHDDQMQWVQVYCCTAGGWVVKASYPPMARKSDTPLTLPQDLLKKVGAPAKLILVKGDFRKIARDGICVIQTEPYSPWQNCTELAIRELVKKAMRRCMARTNTPEVLWSDCIVMEAEVISHTAKPTPMMLKNGLTPQSLITLRRRRISVGSLNSSGIHGYGGTTRKHRCSHNQRRHLAVTWDQQRTLDCPDREDTEV